MLYFNWKIGKGVGFMLNERQFIEEEKDCAAMLGLTLEEYRNSLKNIKVHNVEKERKQKKYDNSILQALGLSEKDLKTRKVL